MGVGNINREMLKNPLVDQKNKNNVQKHPLVMPTCRGHKKENCTKEIYSNDRKKTGTKS
jgi:hypothetical protein